MQRNSLLSPVADLRHFWETYEQIYILIPKDPAQARPAVSVQSLPCQAWGFGSARVAEGDCRAQVWLHPCSSRVKERGLGFQEQSQDWLSWLGAEGGTCSQGSRGHLVWVSGNPLESRQD